MIPATCTAGLLALSMGQVANAESTRPFSVDYSLEFRSNLSGGQATGSAWLDQLLVSTGDEDRWQASVLATNSHTFSDRFSGDVQTLSNVDAGHTLRLYEAWYQWAIGSGSLRFGLIDFNSEFDAIETAGFFTHSSHGIGPDIAQSGEGGPSIFPHPSFALRLDGGSTQWRWRLFAADAVPGDPDHPGRTSVRWDASEGLLLAAELERTGETRWGIGTWQYSRRFERLDGAGRGHQRGLYGFVERPLGTAWGAQWRGFVRLGVAAPDVLAVQHYGGAGVVGRFSERWEAGLGVAHARLGTAGRATVAADGGLPAASETAYELGVGWTPNGHLTLKPLVQYVRNPGARRDLASATVAAVRLELHW